MANFTNQHYVNAKTDFLVSPRKLKEYYANLEKNIATMDGESLKNAGFGMSTTMDAQATQQSSFNTNVENQFLQHWMPGNIRLITAPRRAEEALGVMQAGSFATETIVFKFMEMFGFVQNYGDLADSPKAGYNMEYATRTAVRFQAGIQSDRLEGERQSMIGISDIDEKRASLLRSFNIIKNYVSLFGWAGVRCFGLLNDPNLGAYQTVAATGTGSSPLWANKTTALQQADIQTSALALYTQSKTAFDPYTEAFTWLVTPSVRAALAMNLNLGGVGIAQTLGQWVESTFKNIRIIAIPEFVGANGGSDVWYMFKESTIATDDSTDSGQTILNMVQMNMFQLSALPTKSGGISETFASSQYGTFITRPIFVTRWSGM